MKNDVLYIGLTPSKSAGIKIARIAKKIAKQYGLSIAKMYCHHITLAFRPTDDDAIYQWALDNEGKQIKACIHAYGSSDKAMAFIVDACAPTHNDIMHMTAFTIGDGKPVDSNKITDWHDLSKSIYFYTNVTIFRTHK